MDDIEATEQKARALLNSRIDSVTALVKTRQRVTDAEGQLADAKKEDRKAYVRATKDGWSADELKKLGLEQQPTLRRRQTTKKTTDSPSDPSLSADTQS